MVRSHRQERAMQDELGGDDDGIDKYVKAEEDDRTELRRAQQDGDSPWQSPPSSNRRGQRSPGYGL